MAQIDNEELKILERRRNRPRSRERDRDRDKPKEERKERSPQKQSKESDTNEHDFTEIAFEEIQFIDKIGHGGFGEVWRGLWHNTPVAIKKLLNQGLKKSAIHQMRQEVALHQKLRFPFIVQLLGACTDGHYCVVMEIAPYGNVFTLLYNSSRELPLPLRTAMLFDVARGMDYLHSCDILHRDLKSLNLLIFNHMTIKICDFGLSRIKDNAFLMSNQRVGTAAWMAPEILADSEEQKKEFTPKCDVYSFAMIMFEVLTRSIPFEGKEDVYITNFVIRGKRLSLPDEAIYNDELKDLMQKCWSTRFYQRPDFSSICQSLREILDSVGGDPRTNQTMPFEAPRDQEKDKDQHIDKTAKDKLVEREQKIAEKEAWIEAEFKKLKTEKMNAWIEAELKAHAEKLEDEQLEQQLENDKHAILKFYNDTFPATLEKQETKWDISRDISVWDGVLIESDRIIEIDLSEAGLVGQIANFNGALDKLKVFNCQKNQLSGNIPESICNLYNLEYLSLRNNKLVGSIPASISKLQNLRELYLYQNHISGAVPSSIGQLNELVNLYINQNKITGRIPDSIGNLRNLLIFSACENRLTGSIPPSIGNLENLFRLELQNNKLEGQIPEEIGQLQQLQYLYLQHNKLTGTIPNSIQDLNKLHFLNVSANQLTGRLPEAIGNLSSLVHLDLSENSFNGPIPSSFSKLEQIHAICLNNNNLTGNIPFFFSNFSQLQTLILFSNNFSNAKEATQEFKDKLPHRIIQL